MHPINKNEITKIKLFSEEAGNKQRDMKKLEISGETKK
jgi:hypothetical protein